MSKAVMQRQPVLLLLALLSGAIGTLAFSPFDFWPAAILSLLGLLALPINRSVKQAAWIGFSWGFGLFCSGVSWVYISIQEFGDASPIVALLLVLLLAAYLAVYPLIFSMLINRFWPTANVIRLAIAAPACWQLTEFMRGWVLTGFPWLQFGYSQIDGPMKNLAPITGVPTLNLLLVMITGLLLLAIRQRHWLAAISATCLLLLPMTLAPISWTHVDPSRSVNIALVQGNIPQSLKWDPNQLQKTLTIYRQLSAPYFDKADMIIWPEAAVADLESRQQPFLREMDSLAQQTQTTLLLGIIDYRYEQEDNYYNTLLVLGEKQAYQYPSANRYRKYHLVPFGEFVPFAALFKPIAEILNFPMSSMTPGEYIQAPLKAAGYKMTAAICYEIILGQQVRDNFQPDTDFLLTVSNDTWFGRSIGPWQHLQMARMRALELGRPLIRSTNNGITAVVDSTGQIIGQIPQFEQGVLNITVQPATGITPYARLGSLPYWSMTFILLIFAVRRRSDQFNAVQRTA